MKETNEFSQWSSGAGDAINRSLADGEISFADLGNLIPTVAGATQGVKGFTEIGKEYAQATKEARDADKAIFEGGLSTLEDNDADLIARAQDGVKSIWALAVKATQKDAAEKVAARLASPGALSDPMTAEDWLKVVEG